MNALTRFLQEPVVERLGWTLLHFVWQGVAVAALLAVVLLVLRGRSANARYVAGCVALLAMVACPAMTFSRLGAQLVLPQSMPDPAVAVLPQASASSVPAASPLPASITAVSQEARKVVYSTAADLSRANPPLRKRVMQSLDWVIHSLESLSPWLALAWIGGVVLLSVKLFGGWLLTRRFTGRGTRALVALEETFTELAARVGVTRTVRLLESALAEVPTMIGWLRPVILLPASALTGLTPRQLEAILAHELAHIRRHDYLVNIFQSIAETLLFYHPAVWWVSRRIREEREHACDDIAVEVCGDRVGYVRALTALEELRGTSGGLALAASGGSLLGRIRRLLISPETSLGKSAWTAGLAIIVVAGAFLGMQTRAGGDTPAKDAPAKVAPTFGSEMERWVGGVSGVLDLDTGNTPKPETPEQGEDPAWRKKLGVDLFVRDNHLTSLGMKVTRLLDPGKWDEAPGPWLVDEIAKTERRDDRVDMAWRGGVPVVYGFETSSGRVGVFQIRSAMGDEGMTYYQLRYKLVQEKDERGAVRAPAEAEAVMNFTATREQVERIGEMVKSAPSVAREVLDEKLPGVKGVPVQAAAAEGQMMSFFPLGHVYAKDDESFYLQWDGAGTSTYHFYGPFSGTPEKVLGITRRSFSFGPMTELVVKEAADLDTGNLVADHDTTTDTSRGPNGIADQNGGDVYRNSKELVVVASTRVFAQEKDAWETRNALQVLDSLSACFTEERLKVSPKAPAMFSKFARFELAEGEVCVFCTRSGSKGLLQVVKVAPEGVTIRYKVVRESGIGGPWGEAVDGVTAGLQVDKAVWRPGDEPVLRVRVRNGSERLLNLTRDRGLQQVEIDGTWYRPPIGFLDGLTASVSVPGVLAEVAPGEQWEDVLVPLKEGEWQKTRASDVNLSSYGGGGAVVSPETVPWMSLAPGKHTIRFAFIAQPARAGPGKTIFRVTSNPVDVEVITRPNDRKAEAEKQSETDRKAETERKAEEEKKAEAEKKAEEMKELLLRSGAAVPQTHAESSAPARERLLPFTKGRALSFGSDVDRAVDLFLDFDSGDLPQAPTPERASNPAWRAQQGVDVIVQGNQLVGVDLTVTSPLGEEKWKEAPGAWLLDEIAKAKAAQRKVNMEFRPDTTMTYGFETKRGHLGLVQILGMESKGETRYFRLRYKLVGGLLPGPDTEQMMRFASTWRPAVVKPWDEQLAEARNTTRPDTAEGHLAMLRDLSQALDANPPWAGELLIRNERTHAMHGGFSYRLPSIISWLNETLEKFRDVPTATGVLYAKVRLAEELHTTHDGEDREQWRARFTTPLVEVLAVQADKVLLESPDGKFLSKKQIETVEMPERGWADLLAQDPQRAARKDEWTRLYREELERDRVSRFQQRRKAAAQVLARAQWVKDRPDLTRDNLLKLQGQYKDDADVQSAITAYLAEIDEGIKRRSADESRVRALLAAGAVAPVTPGVAPVVAVAARGFDGFVAVHMDRIGRGLFGTKMIVGQLRGGEVEVKEVPIPKEVERWDILGVVGDEAYLGRLYLPEAEQVKKLDLKTGKVSAFPAGGPGARALGLAWEPVMRGNAILSWDQGSADQKPYGFALYVDAPTDPLRKVWGGAQYQSSLAFINSQILPKPPIVWLDDTRVLTLRTAENRYEVVVVDIKAGKAQDIGPMPLSGRVDMVGPCGDGGDALVVMNAGIGTQNGESLARTFAVDVQSALAGKGKLEERPAHWGQFTVEKITGIHDGALFVDGLACGGKELAKDVVVSVSPDGRRALWQVRPKPSPSNNGDGWDLFLYEAGQKDAPRKVSRGDALGMPVWFSGGK